MVSDLAEGFRDFYQAGCTSPRQCGPAYSHAGRFFGMMGKSLEETRMTSIRARILLFIALACAGALSHSQTAPTRGELLYNTHCISCHSTQMHWRNNKLAHDWPSLKEQVRRWQGNAGLQWGDADILEVTRYLNDTIYNYPADHVSLAGPVPQR
jgi:mono/diheme cytochrome c family protein